MSWSNTTMGHHKPLWATRNSSSSSCERRRTRRGRKENTPFIPRAWAVAVRIMNSTIHFPTARSAMSGSIGHAIVASPPDRKWCTSIHENRKMYSVSRAITRRLWPITRWGAVSAIIVDSKVSSVCQLALWNVSIFSACCWMDFGLSITVSLNLNQKPAIKYLPPRASNAQCVTLAQATCIFVPYAKSTCMPHVPISMDGRLMRNSTSSVRMWSYGWSVVEGCLHLTTKNVGNLSPITKNKPIHFEFIFIISFYQLILKVIVIRLARMSKYGQINSKSKPQNQYYGYSRP